MDLAANGKTNYGTATATASLLAANMRIEFLQSIRSVITDTEEVFVTHARLMIPITRSVLSRIVSQLVPVSTLVQLPVASHPIAFSVKRGIVRMAHDVLA